MTRYCSIQITPWVATRVGPSDDIGAIAEATLTLLQDADHARRIGPSVHASTEQRFSIEAMVEAVEHVYEEVAII